MTVKKIAVLGAAAVAVSAALYGCGWDMPVLGGVNKKTSVTVGNWPDESFAETGSFEMYNNCINQMKNKYPYINIIPSAYRYDVQTFLSMAEEGQIPTIFTTWFTEINKLIKSGYVADVTDAMHRYGYDRALNPELLELISEDGRIYAIPSNSYAQGLFINKNLFKRAGLVNPDGSVKIPDTYEEVAQAAKTINEKTGCAGFVLPATGNYGGWHFMNIAWSFGVKFEVQESDGSWRAAFNTPEAVEALQYVKDLKWKYNAVPENVFIDKVEMMKMFATDQAAMCILDPPANRLVSDYGMNKDNLIVARMPKGPRGRYSQMGGNVQMISSSATEEQIDALFKWLNITGETPDLSDEAYQSMSDSVKRLNEQGRIVLDQVPFKIWINSEWDAKVQKLNQQYCNIDPKDYESYYAFEDVIIKPEIEEGAQDLYAILDACIQEVFTDENADVKALIESAAEKFQKEYLDKVSP